jgi:hypothetical protein
VKFIVRFEETEQALIANMTNSRIIAGLYGDDTDDWIGQRITLYPTETQFNGRMVPAIRVRSKPPQAKRPAPARAAAPRRPGRPAQPMTQEEADADDVPF